MDKFHVVAEQGVAHVRVWSHSARSPGMVEEMPGLDGTL